jgi:hypothetical protein
MTERFKATLDQWLHGNECEVGKHTRLHLTEIDGSRDDVLDALRLKVREHYVSQERTAERLEQLGATKTAALMREYLPLTKRARSGHAGEIIATEVIEAYLDFDVPIRRLRWTDGREMALRGDDIIGIGRGADTPSILKGEVKSRARMTQTVVAEAASAIATNRGRPTRHTVLFVADRLSELGETELANQLDRAVVGSFRDVTVQHCIVTLSGNNPCTCLDDHLTEVRRKKRVRFAIGVMVDDHQGFIASLYEDADGD